MAKDISVAMDWPIDSGENALPEAEKEKEKAEKEAGKEIKAAEKVVDDINAPKGVEVPKTIPLKTLTEKLNLSEELDDDEYSDLVHDLFGAMRVVCQRWARNSDVDYEDFERAIQEAADHLIEIEPELWESMNKGFNRKRNVREAFKINSSLDNYKPWSGAVSTWDKITDAGKVEELDALLEEIYPDGLSETELNDILWFEPEWVLDALGLETENFDGDDYE